MKYGRSDELEADLWGVKLSVLAGYDPRAMLGVMEILDKAGGGKQPELLSTHPKPANRKEYIDEVIREVFPSGVPEGLHE
jgi:beta-barrel assembly-enhancing protease